MNIYRQIMKKLFVFLWVVLLVTSVQAKSLKDLWVSMPDSLLPTLDRNLRLELVELEEMGVKPNVKNLLGEECDMDTLTNDYLECTTSKAARLQMIYLPSSAGDSVLCVIKTFRAPSKESEIRFYDQGWRQLPISSYLAKDQYALGCYIKPKSDTMRVEEYEELKSKLEPVMYVTEYLPTAQAFRVQVSLPLLSNEDKMKVQSILMQRKFKWVLGRFNEI